MTEPKTKVLKVRITPTELAALKALAATQDVSVSEVVREAIGTYGDLWPTLKSVSQQVEELKKLLLQIKEGSRNG